MARRLMWERQQIMVMNCRNSETDTSCPDSSFLEPHPARNRMVPSRTEEQVELTCKHVLRDAADITVEGGTEKFYICVWRHPIRDEMLYVGVSCLLLLSTMEQKIIMKHSALFPPN